jgi:hypothetical protein
MGLIASMGFDGFHLSRLFLVLGEYPPVEVFCSDGWGGCHRQAHSCMWRHESCNSHRKVFPYCT